MEIMGFSLKFLVVKIGKKVKKSLEKFISTNKGGVFLRKESKINTLYIIFAFLLICILCLLIYSFNLSKKIDSYERLDSQIKKEVGTFHTL